MGGPRQTDPGLRKEDAIDPVDVACDHPSWCALNKKLGCIDQSHGSFPFPKSCHFTGLRMVRGVPTRYVPKDKP